MLAGIETERRVLEWGKKQKPTLNRSISENVFPGTSVMVSVYLPSGLVIEDAPELHNSLATYERYGIRVARIGPIVPIYDTPMYRAHQRGMSLYEIELRQVRVFWIEADGQQPTPTVTITSFHPQDEFILDGALVPVPIQGARVFSAKGAGHKVIDVSRVGVRQLVSSGISAIDVLFTHIDPKLLMADHPARINLKSSGV